MCKNNMLKIGLILSLVCFLSPNLSYSRVSEKAIKWDSTIGHTHDGGTEGKKVDLTTVEGDIIPITDDTFSLGSAAKKWKELYVSGGTIHMGPDQKLQLHSVDGGIEVGNRLHLKAESGVSGSVCFHTGTNPDAHPTEFRLWVDDSGDVYLLQPNADPNTHVNYQIMNDIDLTIHTGVTGAHHIKTTLFSDLIDIVTDAQIPNTITINQATNADTVDGAHAVALEESTEIDFDISTHAGIVSAHHNNLSDNLDIIPNTVTVGSSENNTISEYATTGLLIDKNVRIGRALTINSDNSIYKLNFGTGSDVRLYNSASEMLYTDNDFTAGGISWAGEDFRTEGVNDADAAFTCRVTGDSIWKYAIFTGGKQEWGDGTSARDTNLYRYWDGFQNFLKTDDKFVVGGSVIYIGDISLTRSAENILQTAAILRIQGTRYFLKNSTNATNSAYASKVTSDTTNRFQMDTSGKFEWGPGETDPVDVNLYRLSAGNLGTDDYFTVGKSLYVGYAQSGAKVYIKSAGSAATLYEFNDNLRSDDGLILAKDITVDYTDIGSKLYFGSAQDTNLYKASVNLLKTDDNFTIGGGTLNIGDDITLYRDSANVLRFAEDDNLIFFGSVPTSPCIRIRRTGDSNDRFYQQVGGKMEWGDGASSRDTNLYRSGANILQTDDDFTVAGGTINIGDDGSIYDSGIDILQTDDIFTVKGQYNYFNRVGNSQYDEAYMAKDDDDTFWRFTAYVNGQFAWGPGSSGLDTILQRVGVSNLQTEDIFTVEGGNDVWFERIGDTQYDWSYLSKVDGDSFYRFGQYVNGTTYWGPGSSGYDTDLFRGGANLLETNDSLTVGGSLQIDGGGVNLTNGGAEDFTHATTTKITNLHATQFQVTFNNLQDSQRRDIPVYIRPAATSVVCFASAEWTLTPGSTLMSFNVRGATGASVTHRVEGQLFRVDSGNNSTLMANCFFNDGGTSCNDSSIDESDIQNSYRYVVEIQTSVSAGLDNAKFYHVFGEYTTTNLSQTQ